MNCPCELIKDILPLYHDGICSGESIKAVEAHLTECDSCREYYAELCRSGDIIEQSLSTELESRKAESFRSIRRRMHIKQGFACVVAVVTLITLLIAAIGVLKNSEQKIVYNDNISVSVSEGSLVGRLKGDEANRLEIKRVVNPSDKSAGTYLFFCLSGTSWSRLTTGINTFSEYTLCPADKGADTVDFVYYYGGDLDELEELSRGQLESLLEQSELLWSK